MTSIVFNNSTKIKNFSNKYLENNNIDKERFFKYCKNKSDEEILIYSACVLDFPEFTLKQKNIKNLLEKSKQLDNELNEIISHEPIKHVKQIKLKKRTLNICFNTFAIYDDSKINIIGNILEPIKKGTYHFKYRDTKYIYVIHNEEKN